jgi:RNA polymerase sigma-70 factor (ECF subfamily)
MALLGRRDLGWMMADFEVFYEAQYRPVLAACATMCGDLEQARDATDEAFVRALERWSNVAGMLSPGGWVQTVALNCLRRSLRRRTFHPRLRRPAEEPTEEMVLPDLDLWDAVRRLPARQQTAVVLRYVHDLPEAAVAESMGLSRRSASSALSAARARLRAELGDRVPEVLTRG